MNPPATHSSRQAEFVILLYTHREAPGRPVRTTHVIGPNARAPLRREQNAPLGYCLAISWRRQLFSRILDLQIPRDQQFPRGKILEISNFLEARILKMYRVFRRLQYLRGDFVRPKIF